MAGLFDDLIPKAGGKGLSFNDLVPSKATTKPKPTWRDEISGAMANFNRGLIVGDELKAVGSTVEGLMTGRHRFGLDKPGNPVVNNLRMVGDAFKTEMAGQRKTEDDFAERRPNVAALARGTGNALTIAVPVGPGPAAFATGGRMINAVRGVSLAGVSGAGYAALDRGSMTERAGAAARAAYDPLTLALGAGAGAIAGRATPKSSDLAPSFDELTSRKTDAYNRVKASGESYSADQFRGLADDMTTVMADEGFNPGNHPKAAAKLDQISDMAHRAADQPMSISELDQLRQQIGRDVAASPDAGERRMGVLMRQAIDDFIDRSGGSPDLLEARDMNTRVSKLRDLDQLDDKAGRRAARTGAGGNKENTQRQNVDRFLDETGNLTPAEQEQARKVVGGTMTSNVMRQVGKLSPEGNGLGFMVHTVGGVTSGGATLPVAAAGFVAKRVSEAMTSRNVDDLRALIAQGGKPVADDIARRLTVAGADDLLQQLANDLSAAAGVQGASYQGAERTAARSTSTR